MTDVRARYAEKGGGQMSNSYWSTPERLKLLEATCRLPSCIWRFNRSWWPMCDERNEFPLSDEIVDPIIRDHAVRWLNERGIWLVPHPKEFETHVVAVMRRANLDVGWTTKSISHCVGGNGGEQDVWSIAIESGLRWCAEQEEAAK